MIDRKSGVEALAAILQDLRPSRASYGLLSLSAPWGIDLHFQDGVRFHFVVEGACELRLAGMEPMTLVAGDIALLPHGVGHVIADKGTSSAVPLDSLPSKHIGNQVYQVRAGSNGVSSLLVCCTVGFDSPTARRLLAGMPTVITMRHHEQGHEGMGALIDVLAGEARRQRMGMATLLSRLADIIITWVIRNWAETHDGAGPTWLMALREPGLGAAIAAMHDSPDTKWTMSKLARVAGMSRTTFLERFQQRVGQPPGRYLLEWRMAAAEDRLIGSCEAIADIAAAVGYGSEAAFGRAFKRVMGTSPGRMRLTSSRAKGSAPSPTKR